MIILKNKDEFDKFIAENNEVIIDFFATWCGPCKMLAPVLEELQEQTSIAVAKVDVDEAEELAGLFGVTSIPTLLLYKNQKLTKKRLGFCELEALKEWTLADE